MNNQKRPIPAYLGTRYIRVPIDLLQDARLTERQLRTMLALYAHANDEGICNPSRETLSRYTHINAVTAISETTTHLQNMGLLTKKQPQKRAGISTVYTLKPYAQQTASEEVKNNAESEKEWRSPDDYRQSDDESNGDIGLYYDDEESDYEY